VSGSATGPSAGDVDQRVPALVLKLDRNPFHHGALGIIRSLGRAGVPTYAVLEDAASPAGWSRYLRGRFLWNPDLEDEPALLAGLRVIGESIGNRPVLIPTDDRGAILVAEHADVLKAWFRFPDQSRDLPRQLASKEHLADICRAAGVPTPGVQVFSDPEKLAGAADDFDYPTVLKLAEPWAADSGVGVKSTNIVQDPAQLRDLAARLPRDGGSPVLVQDYLPADECEDWFFHGFVGEDQDGKTAFRLSVTGQKIRSFPPTAGITTLGRAWDNGELRQIAERLLTAIGYRGIVDLDFRLDRRTNSFYLLDFNPRVGAQFAVSRRSDGLDAAQTLHRELTGRPAVAQIEQSKDHALCVENYDLASAAWSLAHRRLTLPGWRRTMTAGPVEWAWFARDDLRPVLFMWGRFALRLVTRGRRRAAAVRYPAPVRADRRLRTY
jgi:D-aspartate ligase